MTWTSGRKQPISLVRQPGSVNFTKLWDRVGLGGCKATFYFTFINYTHSTVSITSPKDFAVENFSCKIQDALTSNWQVIVVKIRVFGRPGRYVISNVNATAFTCTSLLAFPPKPDTVHGKSVPGPKKSVGGVLPHSSNQA